MSHKLNKTVPRNSDRNLEYANGAWAMPEVSV